MSSNLPAHSTPSLDFLHRIKARNAGYTIAPFLNKDELSELDGILAEALEKGIDAELNQRAHAYLVMLQDKDWRWFILDCTSERAGSTERQELALLINSASRAKPLHQPR